MVEMRDIDEVEKEEEERRKEEEVIAKRQVDIGRQRVRKRRATDGEREEILELQDRVSDLENRLNVQDEQIRSLKERFREDVFRGPSPALRPLTGYTPHRLPFGIGANPGSVFDRSFFKPTTSCSNPFLPYPSPTIFGVHGYIKFKPVKDEDTMLKNGVSTNVNTQIQCITCMEEYKTTSLEELRLEDYLANRKTGTLTTPYWQM